MRNAFSLKLLFGLLAFGAAGCSGGSTELSSVSIRCSGGQAFCLISCDLGCNQIGCSVTEIAENQRLRFVFSDRIDPGSVNASSVSIRTPSGVAPDGDLLLADRELTFVPRVRSVNGVSTFGFQRNESYVITLPGGGGQGIRSLSGARLERDFSCTVFASRGIQDEDQQPPTVTLVAPAVLTDTSTSPTIVLRFSELIDTTALQGSLSASSPINLIVRGTVSSAGVSVCDLDTAGVAVEGIPQLSTERVGSSDVTVVTFSPPLPLPGSSCLTVNVTADVRDLSGRQGVPSVFRLFTMVTAPQSITVVESFANSANEDIDVSSGVWSNGARPGLLGNDGRHGSFDVATGIFVAATNEYEWDTNNFTIPKERTFDGLADAVIQQATFYFSDFVLPAGKTLRFKGSQPPLVYVRGKAEILGTIKVNAVDMPFWTPTIGPATNQRVQDFNARGTAPLGSGAIVGQLGSLGGNGGGRGGKGGNECTGFGPQPAFNGERGQGVIVATGHAYFGPQALAAGGLGSLLQPLSGLNAPTPPHPLLGTFRANFAPGGAGGGFSGPGGIATHPAVFGTTAFGVVQAGGDAFGLPFPVPLPVDFTSLEHFVVGGSGGGGGASHAFGTANTPGFDIYVAGSGGSGGGGAVAFRVGGNLTVAGSARLEAKGGRGVLITGDDKNNPALDANWGVSSPGGGGSGGSFLLQAGGNVVVSGAIDTSGGLGSQTGSVQIVQPPLTTAAVFSIPSQAGAGASGFYRLEAGGTIDFSAGSGTPTFDSALHAGALNDRDMLSGSMSKWRATGQFFPPQWLRYELDVDFDGGGTIDETFTDSGVLGTRKANDLTSAPVTILFQGARLNQGGTAPAQGESPKPWREGIGTGAGPGIGLDSPTGFRFFLTFDRSVFPGCVVRALRVYAQS